MYSCCKAENWVWCLLGFRECMQIHEVRCERSVQVEKATLEHLHTCQVIMQERHRELTELCDDGCPSASRFLHPNEHSRYLAYVDFPVFPYVSQLYRYFLAPIAGLSDPKGLIRWIIVLCCGFSWSSLYEILDVMLGTISKPRLDSCACRAGVFV